MPAAINQAIAALRKLSPARQEELAGYICHLAAGDREPEDIDPAHFACGARRPGTTQAR